MSTFSLPGGITNSTSSQRRAVDARAYFDPVLGNFTRIVTEWTAGTNTDFFINSGKSTNLNVGMAGPNTVGTNNLTTYFGNIENAKNIEIYNFYVKTPFVQDDTQIQYFAQNGTILEAVATLITPAVGAAFRLDLENDGVVAKANADTNTWIAVDGTNQIRTVFDTGVTAVKYGKLSISVKQVGTTTVGSDLLVEVRVRTT